MSPFSEVGEVVEVSDNPFASPMVVEGYRTDKRLRNRILKGFLGLVIAGLFINSALVWKEYRSINRPASTIQQIREFLGGWN